MCETSKSLIPIRASPTQSTKPALSDQFTAEEEAELKLLWKIHSSYCWRSGNPLSLTEKQQEELDRRTIFVGNVDYGASVQEIEKLFDVCGPVKVQLQTDRFTGRRKNHCFVELSDPLMIQLATVMDQIVFRNRLISVRPKMTQKSPEFPAHRQDYQEYPRGKNKYVLINNQSTKRFNPY